MSLADEAGDDLEELDVGYFGASGFRQVHGSPLATARSPRLAVVPQQAVFPAAVGALLRGSPTGPATEGGTYEFGPCDDASRVRCKANLKTAPRPA